ncbi:M23 family metallopeptidase, partial [Candidatus Peregrinibacteria bacterium]|nr:M23 family metallopeptidase [Candidatus Peregrinibacteria bacterium]
MRTKSLVPLFFGLLGLLIGATLGIHDQRLTAHFGQRLREKPPLVINAQQKYVLRQRLQRSPSDRLHSAAPKRLFPTLYPVSAIPNWGAMRTTTLWNRSYREMSPNEFISVPVYDLQVLTFPMQALDQKNPDDVPLITAKLYYSTRFFSRYDLDAGEFTGLHAGVDLKLPYGTPVGAIADGIVHVIQKNDRLGLFIILQHMHPTEGTLFSIYGHLANT